MSLVLVRVEADDAEHDVVLGAASVGRILGRQVRSAEQDPPQLAAHVLDLAIELVLAIAQGPTLRLQCLGGRHVAGLPELTDLARDPLHPVADLVALHGEVTLPSIELDGAVDFREVFPATRQGGLHALGVGAQAPDVDHASPLIMRGR